MRKPTLDSVANALSIIRMFEHSRELTVTQVARELDVAKSTAHRLLTTLVERGFAQRDLYRPHYLPGEAIVAAGLGAMGALDVHRRATTHAEYLARNLNETVNLVVLQGAYARCVVSIPPGNPEGETGGALGRLLPLHASASGKILLMDKSEEEIRRRFPSGLPAVTSHTITDLDRLMVDLAKTRRRNWALSNQESTIGVTGVAVPVIGETTRLAAIAVAASTTKLSHARLSNIVEELFRASERISRAS